MPNNVKSVLICVYSLYLSISFLIFGENLKNMKSMIRNICLILAGGLLPSVASAQAETVPEAVSCASDSLDFTLPAPVPTALSAPRFEMYGITPLGYGYNTWNLHEGMNASFGMSLTFSPDKWMPSGTGFGQDLALLYATPLTSRLSVAGGVYASHLSWGWIKYQNVGIAGIAAYRLTDRISLYAYGNKSLTPQDKSPFYYPLPQFNADRLGGMVNFKVGESASIGIGIEHTRYPAYP